MPWILSGNTHMGLYDVWAYTHTHIYIYMSNYIWICIQRWSPSLLLAFFGMSLVYIHTLVSQVLHLLTCVTSDPIISFFSISIQLFVSLIVSVIIISVASYPILHAFWWPNSARKTRLVLGINIDQPLRAHKNRPLACESQMNWDIATRFSKYNFISQ